MDISKDFRKYALDKGVSSLSMHYFEKNLEFFVLGFKVDLTNRDAITTDCFAMEIDVPVAWQKYFYRQDPEYGEYLRLKNKFDGR